MTPESIESVAADDPAPYTWQDALLQFYCRVLVLTYVFIAYALSLGPMYWLWYESEHGSHGKLVAIIYQPLRWACRLNPLGDFMEWYLTFWL